MKLIRKLIAGLTLGLGALSLSAAPAAAATSYTLFGEAAVTTEGSNTVIQAVSDNDPGFGGIGFEVPEGTTFADLTTLSTDYNVTDDDCGGGSPRFQLNVDTNDDGTSDGNIWVYLGPSPNFTDCPAGWQTSGNLIGNADAGRYDFTSLGGPLGTYADAPVDVLNGKILGIQLVIDSSWSADATNADGEQTVLFDNVTINGDVYDFEPVLTYPASKDECKKNGWKSFTGVVFKNQGDCVSFVATGGRNQPANSPTF